MNLLALDTSSSLLTVALQKGADPVREIAVQGFMSHMENLLPSIDQLLREASLSLDQMDTLLIGRGPGSFTGLRVGFAALKALQFVRKKDCYGALSLDMIAENFQRNEGSHLAVCLDARREKIYTRFYARAQQTWQCPHEPQLLTMAELIRALPQGAHVSGDALLRYRQEFESARQSRAVTLAEETQGYPRASSLIRLYHEKSKALKKLQSPEDFLPYYLRQSEAEERHQEAHGRRDV